jgi:C4-dicarboxylate-specific signal transduction histidine kinase
MDFMEKKYSILIAEDAPVQGKKLQYVLEKFGYHVKWCLNGKEAFDECKKNNIYSLIISDYQMPEVDGLQFLQMVKSDEDLKKVPFILLTTIEDENVFFNSLEFGANEFLNKPFKAEELKLRSKNLILLYEYQKLIETENQGLSNELQVKNQILKDNYEKLEKAHIDLKNFQEQIVQSSKAISLGTLGAGMAHEINNPLTIIQNYNKKLSLSLAEKELSKDQLQQINLSIGKAVTRIKTIVEHLREFSHDSPRNADQIGNINLNNLLIDLRDFYGGFLSKFNIDIQESFKSDEVIVSGFKTPIEQVLLNVIHNAVDAVNENKTGKKLIEIEIYTDAEFGIVEIRDNGPGIPSDVSERIFDAFFTTKDIGKGIGLGLSLVRSYMNECQGVIEFKSAPGKTSFILKFKKVNI